MARVVKSGQQMRFITDEKGVLTGYVDDLEQDRVGGASGFAAAVEGAAQGVLLKQSGIGLSSTLTALEYRRLQRVLRPAPVTAPSLMTYYVDSNRGLDTNPGTSKGAPLQTISAVAAKALAPGNVIALANDSVFSLANRINFPVSGGAGNPIWLTHYDPTGDFPTDRPTVSWVYKPTAGSWSWDGARGAWYFTNPNNRRFERHAYVRIAGQYWGICYGTTYSALSSDFRFAVDDATYRIYLYAPPGTNPTDYYGGPGSVVLGEAQGGALTWYNQSNWTVENIRGAELGYLLHVLTDTANATGFEFRGCAADLCSGVVYASGSDAYYTTARVIDCLATRTATAAFRPQRSSYQWLISHCRTIDGNNCESAGGSVYFNEFSATATAARGDNVVQYCYAQDIKSGIGDHPVDGAAFYAEQRSSGVWIGNIAVDCAVGIQDNSGSSNTFVSNLLHNVNTALLCTDASAIGNQKTVFDHNTVILSRDRRGVSTAHTFSKVAPVYAQNGGAGKSLKARGNVIVADGVGETDAVFRFTAGTTLDLSANTVPAGMAVFGRSSDGSVLPAPPSTLAIATLADGVGTLDGAACAAATDLLGEPFSRGSRRGCFS